jgi:sugar transferase (PEP-CTERM/EpsH1 system associated)
LRVLILTPQLPYPPHQGTTLRNYNLIAGLSRRHHIHLLSFTTAEDDLDRAEPLRQVCQVIDTAPQPARTIRQRLWTALGSRLPDMAHRLASPAMQSTLERVLREERFDVVELEGIEMAPYLPTLLDYVRNQGGGCRLVFDDHNAEYVLQRRIFVMDIRQPRRWPGAVYSFMQWQKLVKYEAWVCRHVDAVAAVSVGDAQALQRIVPGLQVAVVPNGVDIGHYAGFVADDCLAPNSLIFVGKMDFRPNVDAVLWFARRVLPLVRQEVPDARFYIVGQRPHRRLDSLRGQPGVVVTGRVPDILPYVAGAQVYVIPLRSGGGTRLKVLEAMAMRRPIVSTSMGCDGFPVEPGREVILADEPQGFARQVVALLQDPERREELGEVGFRFAAAHYDWSMIVPRLESTYAA